MSFIASILGSPRSSSCCDTAHTSSPLSPYRRTLHASRLLLVVGRGHRSPRCLRVLFLCVLYPRRSLCRSIGHGRIPVVSVLSTAGCCRGVATVRVWTAMFSRFAFWCRGGVFLERMALVSSRSMLDKAARPAVRGRLGCLCSRGRLHPSTSWLRRVSELRR